MPRTYPVSYLSKGTHGFPLPDIRIWNKLSSEVRQVLDSRGGVFRGSVEDLPDTSCEYCHGEMIRQCIGNNTVFVVGAIHCLDALEDGTHPKDYWIEIWPNANYSEDWNADQSLADARIINLYRLSDPRIKRVFDLSTYALHANLETLLHEADPTHKVQVIPDPVFVHS